MLSRKVLLATNELHIAMYCILRVKCIFDWHNCLIVWFTFSGFTAWTLKTQIFYEIAERFSSLNVYGYLWNVRRIDFLASLFVQLFATSYLCQLLGNHASERGTYNVFNVVLTAVSCQLYFTSSIFYWLCLESNNTTRTTWRYIYEVQNCNT